MMITDRINFRQPKYVLPAILYPLLLVTGYLVMDIFDTEVADAPSKLQTTEFLNPELPEAQMRNDGIGGKYESMVKSYGRIQDYSAVENIERNNNETDKEAYDSKYSEEDLALLDSEAAERSEELERLRAMQERLRKSAEKGEAMLADSVGLEPREKRCWRIPSAWNHSAKKNVSPGANNVAKKHWLNWTKPLPKQGNAGR